MSDSFERALNRFKVSLSAEDSQNFSHTTLEDVHRVIVDIQKEQSKNRTLQSMRRTQPYINGLVQFSGVIEVFVQAQPVASSYTESFDKLLDAFEDIGQNLPRFDQYSKFYNENERIQEVIAMIYVDIMEFHRKALKFFQKRAWKTVFLSLWTTFDDRFQNILQNISKHKELIENEAKAAEIMEAQLAREKALGEYKDNRGERERKQSREVISWLSPCTFEIDLERLRERRHAETGGWLSTVPEVKDWFNDASEERLIWLHGIPGSASLLIDQALERTLVTVYFFCDYRESSKNNASAIIRSLIAQLLPYCLHVLNSTAHPYASSLSLKRLKPFFEDIIGNTSSIRLIIDGLDECGEDEQDRILSVLLPLNSNSFRILISSRDTGPIRKRLAKASKKINITNQNGKDIDTYIKSEVVSIQERFGLESDRCKIIVEYLSKPADVEEVRMTLYNLPMGIDAA
ncbi:hypothetical protein RUND412_010191 [Rhizina undulata]